MIMFGKKASVPSTPPAWKTKDVHAVQAIEALCLAIASERINIVASILTGVDELMLAENIARKNELIDRLVLLVSRTYFAGRID